MQIYETTSTDMGDTIAGRVVLFVPKNGIQEDGSITNFSLSMQRHSANETGHVFIIDESDQDKVPRCKVINGELVEPE